MLQDPRDVYESMLLLTLIALGLCLIYALAMSDVSLF